MRAAARPSIPHAAPPHAQETHEWGPSRQRIPPDSRVRTALLLVAVAPWLLTGCGGGASAEPTPSEPIAATGVTPGSGVVVPEGHRETDTDLDTWVAPDLGEGEGGGGDAWYAFPLPSGFEAITPPEGTELLVQSVGGERRTIVSVTRLAVSGPLTPDLVAASVAQGGRTPLGAPAEREVGGVDAIAVDALDTGADPAMTLRQIVLDVGADRLVLTIATPAEPTEDAQDEIGLVELVVVDNLVTEVLD